MQIIWQEQEVDITKLKPSIYNPRKLNKKAKEVFVVNHEKYGEAEPIVVNQDYTIIGGHMRFNVYKEKKVSKINVMYPNRLLSQKEEKSLNVKLNSISGYTEASKVMDLGLSLSELSNIGFDEIKMPEEKSVDKTNVEQGKQKNALIYNLYYFPDDFFFVQGVLDKIRDKYKVSQSQAVFKLLTEY